MESSSSTNATRPTIIIIRGRDWKRVRQVAKRLEKDINYAINMIVRRRTMPGDIKEIEIETYTERDFMYLMEVIGDLYIPFRKLLVDSQINVPKTEIYFFNAWKTREEIELERELNIPPSYVKCSIHEKSQTLSVQSEKTQNIPSNGEATPFSNEDDLLHQDKPIVTQDPENELDLFTKQLSQEANSLSNALISQRETPDFLTQLSRNHSIQSTTMSASSSNTVLSQQQTPDVLPHLEKDDSTNFNVNKQTTSSSSAVISEQEMPDFIAQFANAAKNSSTISIPKSESSSTVTSPQTYTLVDDVECVNNFIRNVNDIVRLAHLIRENQGNTQALSDIKSECDSKKIAEFLDLYVPDDDGSSSSNVSEAAASVGRDVQCVRDFIENANKISRLANSIRTKDYFSAYKILKAEK